MILSENKIVNNIANSEFLLAGYKGDIRKDRIKGGGGVIIAYKDSILNVVQVEIDTSVSAETINVD